MRQINGDLVVITFAKQLMEESSGENGPLQSPG